MKKVMVFDKSKSQSKPRYTEALNKHLNPGSNAEIVVDNFKQIVIEFGNDYVDIDDLLNKLEIMADDIKEIYLIPHDDKNEKFVKKDVDHIHIYIKTTKHKNTLYSIINKVKKTNKQNFESQLQNLNKINIKILTFKQKIQQQRNNMPQIVLHTRSIFSVDTADLQNIQTATDAKLIKPFGVEIPVGSALSGTGNELENIKQNQRTKKLPLYYEFYIQNVNNSLTNQQRQNLINDLQQKFGNNIKIITNNNNEIEFKIKNFTIKNNELIINKKETLFLELLKELERHNILVLNMDNKTEAIFKSINDDLIEKKNSNNPKLQQEYTNYINSVIQTFTNKPVIKTSQDVEDRFLTIYQKDLEKYKEKLPKLKNQKEIQIYQNVIQQLERILNQNGIQIQQEENEIEEVKEESKEIKEETKINIENITDEELKKQLEDIEKEIENIKNNKYLNNDIKKEALKDLENKRIETYNEYINKVKEQLENELKEKEEKLKELENKLENKINENKELNEKIKELQEMINELKEKEKELNDLLNKKDIEINELNKKINELNNKANEYNNKIKQLNKELEKIYNENDKLKNELNKEKEINKELENKNRELEEEKENLQNEIENKNIQVRELNNKIEKEEKEINELKNKNNKLEKELKEKYNKLDTIESINKKIDNILKDKNIDINKKIELLEKIKKENKEKIISNSINNTIILLKKLKEEKIEINNKNKELNNKDNELNNKDKRIEKLEKEIKEIRKLLDDSAKVIESLIKITEEQKLDKNQKEIVNNIKKTFSNNFKPKN